MILIFCWECRICYVLSFKMMKIQLGSCLKISLISKVQRMVIYWKTVEANIDILISLGMDIVVVKAQGQDIFASHVSLTLRIWICLLICRNHQNLLHKKGPGINWKAIGIRVIRRIKAANTLKKGVSIRRARPKSIIASP